MTNPDSTTDPVGSKPTKPAVPAESPEEAAKHPDPQHFVNREDPLQVHPGEPTGTGDHTLLFGQ